ncbi:MAG: 4-(cytidine 5'-diphospho)-2-C-methyl-D-erythritol kinase [Chitinophagaceae bacterium]|nr:4-(cytidine 5'-diphospho)-2-C-methyl-D-erythritol kinase [Chitinophagaceae bacterium]
MIVFPNCKINLGLNIISKREDGFHNLETIFYPLMIKDCLEILPTHKKENNFTITGIPINVDSSQNICSKAWQLLKLNFPQLPNIQLHLHKTIPTGAGLGGGSANGAFTLQLLNKLFQLQLTTNQLINFALQLGSDCPFFIINTPCYSTSRGEQLQPINLSLSNYYFVIVNPQIHINTATAFSTIQPIKPQKSVSEIIHQPIETWKEDLVNDFEKNIFLQYPAIEKIKINLYQQGAVYASMSGTGSTVYGIFERESSFVNYFPSNYFVQQVI